MSQLLEGKTALILGVANRWSLAYAIAQAFQREGARAAADLSGRRLQKTVEELGAELERGAHLRVRCHQGRRPGSAQPKTLRIEERLDAVVHSIAFANASRPRPALRRNFARRLSAGAECQRLLDGRGGARDGPA